MKRKYESPMAYEEVFVANEYVAACYYLACEKETRKDLAKIATRWMSPEYGPDTSHAVDYKKNSCTDPAANRIVSDDGFFHGAEVGEYNWKQGWIKGGIDSWIDNGEKGKLDPGDVIYWHTLSNDGKRRWNHVGTLQPADSSRPNHS